MEGLPGDLYIFLSVEPSNTFIREGHHIILPVPISISQASLGDKITVETLDGEQNIAIPPGTQFGHKIKIAGAGVPLIRGTGRGDFIVLIQVMVPEKLSKKQRSLLKELGQTFEQA